ERVRVDPAGPAGTATRAPGARAAGLAAARGAACSRGGPGRRPGPGLPGAARPDAASGAGRGVARQHGERDRRDQRAHQPAVPSHGVLPLAPDAARNTSPARGGHPRATPDYLSTDEDAGRTSPVDQFRCGAGHTGWAKLRTWLAAPGEPRKTPVAPTPKA